MKSNKIYDILIFELSDKPSMVELLVLNNKLHNELEDKLFVRLTIELKFDLDDIITTLTNIQ
jgi:hypothetical protein